MTMRRKAWENLRLCLLRQSLVEGGRVESIVHAVAQHVDNINSGVRGRARLIVAAEAAGIAAGSQTIAGSTAACRGAAVGDLWRRAGHTTDRKQVGARRSLRWHVDGESSGGLIVLTLSGHCGGIPC